MLTETERRESSKLLKRLTSAELLSLKDTVTKRQISVEDKNEAVKAILDYSASAVELLRRKKVRRDLLFQYLANCGVIVSVNSEKQDLICRVLEHWGSSVPTDDLGDIDSATDVVEAAPQTVVVATAVPSTHITIPSSQHQTLGETFVQWFYELLNAENPTASRTRGGFGPQHFWENCSLKLVSKTPDVVEESFEGSELVAKRLAALAREEHLLFNPNISPEGVRVRSDPHGLLIVMACGTIHRNNSCLGVFEQLFGLVRCPLNENSWKVKVSQLQIKSSQVTTIPKLTDSSANELLPITALHRG